MNEFNTVILDNKLEYMIINNIKVKDYNYLILVNLNDYKDFAIRKEVQNELIGLNDDVEFNNVLLAFFRKIGEL